MFLGAFERVLVMVVDGGGWRRERRQNVNGKVFRGGRLGVHNTAKACSLWRKFKRKDVIFVSVCSVSLWFSVTITN